MGLVPRYRCLFLLGTWILYTRNDTHIVNPVSRKHPPRIQPLVKTPTSSPNLLGHHLSRVHGHHDTVPTHPNTRNHAADVPSRQTLGRTDLDDDADAKDNGGSDDGPFAAKLVGDWVRGHGRDEGPRLLEADRQRAHIGGAAGAKVLFEGLEGEDAARDARVVAGEEG